MDVIKFVENQLLAKRNWPDFQAGDTVVVTYNIVEGDKTRPQDFRGDIIQIKGHNLNKTFTIRKISHGVGVERIFPYSCPNIVNIQVQKKGKVRRARLFYLRALLGKKARIKEKAMSKESAQ